VEQRDPAAHNSFTNMEGRGANDKDTHQSARPEAKDLRQGEG